jgi:hypothetical protein
MMPPVMKRIGSCIYCSKRYITALRKSRWSDLDPLQNTLRCFACLPRFPAGPKKRD